MAYFHSGLRRSLTRHEFHAVLYVYVDCESLSENHCLTLPNKKLLMIEPIADMHPVCLPQTKRKCILLDHSCSARINSLIYCEKSVANALTICNFVQRFL